MSLKYAPIFDQGRGVLLLEAIAQTQDCVYAYCDLPEETNIVSGSAVQGREVLTIPKGSAVDQRQ